MPGPDFPTGAYIAGREGIGHIHDRRIAFARLLPDQSHQSALAFLRAALDYFTTLGLSIRRVMTDNGNCYRSDLFRQACNDAGIRHLRTKPYTPRTNGKAERFIQTVLRECAYARPFHSSPERADALPRWTHAYNVHRPHTALTGKPPISRLDQNNLLANDS